MCLGDYLYGPTENNDTLLDIKKEKKKRKKKERKEAKQRKKKHKKYPGHHPWPG